MTGTIFEKLKSEGIQMIHEMIESEFQETLTLDFKANLTHPADPLFANDGKKLTKSGRKVIAKAASAFANSMGGVLILGVDCRSVDGIDCARSITPIASLAKALSTINNELHSITVPSINGIEAISLVADGEGSGLIAVSVPRSDRRPHRSNAADARSYFKRSGTSTVEMEHYEIEDAFLSNQSPDLSVELTLRPTGSGGATETGERPYHFSVDVVVANTGGGLAKHLFLQCRHDEGVSRGFGSRHSASGNQIGIIDGAWQVALPSEVFVHPGTRRIIENFPITVFFCADTNKVRVGKVHCDANSFQSFMFDFCICAEGMRKKHQIIEIELGDLISCGQIPA
ncbi:helix-turn-helix domain-containing protein [Primorskyibacter sp. 2E233]|uniref:AlbA family DNA-binding domain-containing protein n=1 Tax=Primorskyibacter sp. 2E233 TaxID=3413431 RepID=UPI003BEFE743